MWKRIAEICDGDASWLVNLVCSPVVLVWNYLTVYFVPCLGVMLMSAVCAPFRLLCSCCFGKYTDSKFPPSAKSVVDISKLHLLDDLNELKRFRSEREIDSEIEWKRAAEVVAEGGKRARLFDNGVDPRDVLQGNVGDCWLLAAIASMAEHEAAIRNCFENVQASLRGKYVIRLYDAGNERWERVTVDDWIPVRKGSLRPYFTSPNGNELWVFLLEKAFAKFCDGYANLDGGLSPWAWKTLTGDNVFSLKRGSNVWRRSIYVFSKAKDKMRRRDAVYGEDTFERFDDDRVVSILRKYSSNKSVMACASHSQSLVQNTGLVASHAYSLLHVERLHTGSDKYLVKLRNPWGQGEWNGRWSDNSPEWDRHPILKRLLRVENDDKDGTFWMAIADFLRIFDRIDVCDRSTHRDLRLNVHEGEICGLPRGCAGATGWFWCLFGGVRTIYAGHRSQKATVQPGCSCAPKGKAWIEDEEAYSRRMGHKLTHV